MASSTNPREYVQRIGRIIRQAPEKSQADIYDLIIHPDLSGYKEDVLSKIERRVFEKEMERVKDLSTNALNNSSVLNLGRVSDINRENFAKSLITVSKKKQLILAFTPSEYSTEIRKYFDASVVSSYNKMISVDEEITRQEV